MGDENRRENETDERSEKRLERVRLGDENRRENETDERRVERLEGGRARQTTTRENESEVRLENDGMRQVNVRQNEDDEHRETRLINNRVRIPRICNIARRTITAEIPASHNIGLLTTDCPHCDAFSFHQENYNCSMAG